MFTKALTMMSILVASVALATLSTTAVAGGNNTELKLRADLSGKKLASGKAKYRERMRDNTLEQRFDIEVEDATPGDQMMVQVNGVTFGTIIINDFGVGELQFRTSTFIDDPGDGEPNPTDFPRLQPGDVVTVGPLNGAFALD